MYTINTNDEQIKLGTTIIDWKLRYEDGEFICNRHFFTVDELEKLDEIKKQIDDAAFRQDTAAVDRLMALQDGFGRADQEKRFRSGKDAIAYFVAGYEHLSERAHKLVAKFDPTLGNWEP